MDMELDWDDYDGKDLQTFLDSLGDRALPQGAMVIRDGRIIERITADRLREGDIVRIPRTPKFVREKEIQRNIAKAKAKGKRKGKRDPYRPRIKIPRLDAFGEEMDEHEEPEERNEDAEFADDTKEGGDTDTNLPHSLIGTLLRQPVTEVYEDLVYVKQPKTEAVLRFLKPLGLSKGYETVSRLVPKTLTKRSEAYRIIPTGYEEYVVKGGMGGPTKFYPNIPSTLRNGMIKIAGEEPEPLTLNKYHTTRRYDMEWLLGDSVKFVDTNKTFRVVHVRYVLASDSPEGVVVTEAELEEVDAPFGMIGLRYAIGDSIKLRGDPQEYRLIKKLLTLSDVDISDAEFPEDLLRTVEVPNENIVRVEDPLDIENMAGKSKSVEEFYYLPVPDTLRKLVVSLYVNTLKDLKETPPNISDVISVAPPSQSNRNPLPYDENIIRDPLNWEAYYAREFEQWHFARVYDDLRASLVDTSEVWQRTNEVHDQQFLLTNILNSLNGLYPDDNFTQHDANDLVQNIKSKREMNLYDPYIIQHLDRLAIDRRLDAVGYALVEEISIALEDFYNSVNSEDFYWTTYENILEQIIRERFVNVEVTEEERLQFDHQHLTTLENSYETYRSEFNNYARSGVPVTSAATTVPASPLEWSYQVKKYEQIVYGLHSDSVWDYLSDVLFPYLFLGGSMSRYARYFKRSILQGMILVDEMNSLDIKDFLPELMAANQLPTREIRNINITFQTMLRRLIDSTIQSYYTVIEPTMSRNIDYNLTLLFPERFLRTVEQICRTDEEDNTIITYDEVDDLWVCENLIDLLRRFEANNFTSSKERPYSEEFVARVRRLGRGIDLSVKPVESKPVAEVPSVAQTLQVPTRPKLPERTKPTIIAKKGKSLRSIALLGEPLDSITAIDTSLEFVESNSAETIEHPITDKITKNSDVVIYSFFWDSRTTMEDIRRIKFTSGVSNHVLIMGDLSSKERTGITYQLRRILTAKNISDVNVLFSIYSYDDLLRAVTDAVMMRIGRELNYQ